jgi:hypothetical protein
MRSDTVDMGKGYDMAHIAPNPRVRADYLLARLGDWFKSDEQQAKFVTGSPKAEVLLNPALEPVAIILRASTQRQHVEVTVSDKIKPPLHVYIREWQE